MDINRRDFFKLAGVTTTAAVTGNLGITEAAKNNRADHSRYWNLCFD